jgi:pilus assembly protein CpaD
MIGKLSKTIAVSAKSAALLVSASVLAACNMQDVILDDKYSPSYDDRYAIRVEKAPATLGVVSHEGTLSAEQINAVSGFATAAKSNAQSAVTIKYPSGSPGAREAARDIAELMVQRGVSPSNIRAASYAGGRGAPVEVTYLRKVAVTKACGDWSTNLAVEKGNDGYENFGCSTRHNMAAMVTNPEDFEGPRPLDPTLAANRMAALKIYMDNPRAGNVSSTTLSAGSTDDSSSGGGGDNK